MQQEINKDKIAPTEGKHWQWKKGDEWGTVVTIKDIDDEWINFNEGGRLAVGLKDEFLENLNDDLAADLMPSNSTGADPLGISKPNPIPIETKPIVIVKSPIRLLFDKQKKNNKTTLILEFPINIPHKDMYELMSTSFDADEVNTELTDFILDQLAKDDISVCLNKSIESLIKSKYKSE